MQPVWNSRSDGGQYQLFFQRFQEDDESFENGEHPRQPVLLNHQALKEVIHRLDPHQKTRSILYCSQENREKCAGQ